jgi:hypothetical protein
MKLPQPVYRVVQRVSPLWSSATGTGRPRGRHEAGGDTLDRVWRETTGDPIYGPSLELAAAQGVDIVEWRCVHCHAPIRYVDEQGWVHVGPRGTFGCRDDEHGFLIEGQHATPPPHSSPVPSSPEPAPAPDADAPDPPPVPTARPRPYPQRAVVGTYPRGLIEGIRLTGDDAP